MLELHALQQVFNAGDVNEVHALRGIDLQVPRGQFVTMIGSNGAGKSTVFNAIAGVIRPTQGRVVIDAQDVTDWPEHRRAALIGRVFQDPLMGTAASMTIAENLTLAGLRGDRLKLRSGVSEARRDEFREVLAPLGLGLEQRLDTSVSLLSGGQRQALTLLMAALARPKVLLLDEHTGALDPSTGQTVLELTQQVVSEAKLTTLMITHNMQQALAVGERLLMMDRGRIVLDLDAEVKRGMSVSALVDKFREVKGEQLADDELLLSAH